MSHQEGENINRIAADILVSAINSKIITFNPNDEIEATERLVKCFKIIKDQLSE